MTSRQPPVRRQRRASRSIQPQLRTAKTSGIHFSCLTAILMLGMISTVLWATINPSPGVLAVSGVLLFLLLICLGGVWMVSRQRLSFLVEEQEEKQAVSLGQTATIPRLIQLQDIQHLHPSEFEAFVGVLLTTTGHAQELHQVGGTGDQGIDLIGKDRWGRHYVVQCKRYASHRSVGSPEMRNFIGSWQSSRSQDPARADGGGLFVTTSSFTSAAKEAARPFPGSIELLTGADLEQLTREFQAALPAEWVRRLLR